MITNSFISVRSYTNISECMLRGEDVNQHAIPSLTLRCTVPTDLRLLHQLVTIRYSQIFGNLEFDAFMESQPRYAKKLWAAAPTDSWSVDRLRSLCADGHYFGRDQREGQRTITSEGAKAQPHSNLVLLTKALAYYSPQFVNEDDMLSPNFINACIVSECAFKVYIWWGWASPRWI